jgi:hypothetical protein
MSRRAGVENRPTQTARLVELLRDRSPRWVPLPEILNLRISQYWARLYKARHEWGLKIESRVQTVDGVKYSWFRLIDTSPAAQPATEKTIPQSADPLPLFAERGR